MDEFFDENGWAHVHHAAFNGYHKSVSRFIKDREDQLELQTQDGKECTPLLLACSSGVLETVQLLIELGANVKVTNRQSFGVADLAASNNHVKILEYFLELKSNDLDVWGKLIDRLSGNGGPELETSCARALVELTTEDKPKNLEAFIDAKGTSAAVKLLKNSLSSEETKVSVLSLLMNLIRSEVAKEQLGTNDCFLAIIHQLKETNRSLYLRATQLLGELAYNTKNKESIVNSGAVDALVPLLENADDDEVIQTSLNTLETLADSNTDIQTAIGNNKSVMKSLVILLGETKNKHVLATIAKTISMIVKSHTANQNAFVAESGVEPLLELMRMRSRECQIAAVQAVRSLAENNEANQRIVTEHGCVMMLMRLLKRSRAADLRTLTAEALWAIAGNSAQQRLIAAEIGVNVLIEFLSENLPESLHFIGSEALGVLAEGVHKKRGEIAKANGVMPLVRLLAKTATPAYIILSVLRTLRVLCLCLGFRPHTQNQQAVIREGGIKFLIRFMNRARQEIIKVEAAYTLGCVALGNPDRKTITENREFDYIHMLRLLYDEDEDVQLLAGAALAVFAYNNVENQETVAARGGVHYNSFFPFLESKDKRQVAHAAFQVVILSRIIPYEDQSAVSAQGIKLLVALLESDTEDIQALTANFIGGLAHTRAGIPQAIISIGTVTILCKLLMSPFETVQAAAAIALGYLSYDSVGERELLNMCRHDPFLFTVLQFHAGKVKLSSQFIDRWQHCKTIGLPPIK